MTAKTRRDQACLPYGYPYTLGLEADGESTEVYFESVTFPSLLYKNIGFEVEISHT